MSKIAVIATSTSCLDYVDISTENLRIWRMKITIEDDSYNDFTEITADAFYDKLLQNNNLVPSSSMPSPGELHLLLDDLKSNGYDEVIIITISSELSGTFNATSLALNAYEGDIKTHVIDSKNAAISEGFLSLEALRLIDEGKTAEEIISYLEKLRINRKQYFMVDNLRLFVANGRLSGASGFIGSMFKIKPILEVNDDGKIVPFKKIRTQKRALKEMVELVINDLRDIDNFIVTYDTSNNKEGFAYIKERMEEAFPNYRHIEAPITPVIGCHTGIGTVGIAYFDLDI
ncbi:MAG: DegV family protein [Candidatus Izemoplasma sp.]|nr:DegV family protein [Candidatus Izemoplasma sp.]